MFDFRNISYFSLVEKTYMPPKTESFSIKDWDVSVRQREKLKIQGASFLSNAELLAVLIGSGTVNQSTDRTDEGNINICK